MLDACRPEKLPAMKDDVKDDGGQVFFFTVTDNVAAGKRWDKEVMQGIRLVVAFFHSVRPSVPWKSLSYKTSPGKKQVTRTVCVKFTAYPNF